MHLGVVICWLSGMDIIFYFSLPISFILCCLCRLASQLLNN
jgi:hypothetical protein